MAHLDSQLPRIGFGWDRHALVPGRPCRLGGMDLPCDLGPAGHSDGDVLLHALTDALLGAAGLDDLGTLFPDSDPQWRGAASERFLEHAIEALTSAGLRPWSVDLVIIAEEPKMAPHRAELRRRLAAALALPPERVNLKGKTTEGGAEAAAHAIEVHAVVLVGPA